ncbi:MAG: sugar ABC transporter permease [Oscillospiraceae bacterium]|nr:sugar ABC transporter permease [Oscillospiraceae bacterium]MDD4369085.1 sugar ABC transporter permease [Oscillospiraceae bacterium]
MQKTTPTGADHAAWLRHSRITRRRRDTLVFTLFILPALFLFLNVVGIPFLLGVCYSFSNWGGFGLSGSQFTGLTNYREALQDRYFIAAFGRSFVYALFMLVFVNLLGFFLALLLTQKFRSHNLLRSIFFMPNLIGGLILGFIWQFIFSRLFTQLGTITGSSRFFFNWLTSDHFSFAALVIVGIWQQAGYVMIIYIAGLQAIPSDVTEAASIDGASPWQRLTRITIPLMIPSFTVNLFVTLSNAMKQYDINLSLTNGGPGRSTELVAMNIFNSAYRYQDFAQAQAKAVLFFIVILSITLVQINVTKSREVQL